ncbi:MAG: hypothetical protein QF872_09250 [Gammaproteobacteria bacterium]|nr:hypothetical protein [Gammaproteobacteria bacterium]
MPFKALKLLLAYDNTRGHCGRVADRMDKMLEDRAFTVDSLPLTSGEETADLDDYDGLILGIPVLGLGRQAGVTDVMRSFVVGLDDLDEQRVALFIVYEFRHGTALERFSRFVEDEGGEIIGGRLYKAFSIGEQEHELPTECMIRIR